MAQKGLHVQARLLCGAAIAALSVFSGAAVAQASPQPKALFDIEPQPLASALKEFSAQSKQSLLFTPELTDRLTTRGVTGAADVPSALNRVLEGTGLTYRLAGDTYLIVQAHRPRVVEPTTFVAAETVTGSAIEGLVVTAQKRREQIQDVPIAISAFSADALQAQKIEGGFDLLKAIPNVTFSKNNFSSYNFSIRGIGTKAISVATDPGVAVEFNDTPLIRNRLFEQEYFDVERVEVLRGPQGTLHGRNATAGVINVISSKPELDAFDGSLKGEVGNFHTKRLSGFVNVPLIEDVLGVRFAGSLTSRDGYDYNATTQNPVNGRDLWSGRLTIGFAPTDALRADLIWERFNEDDDRSRTGKQLCHRDPGPTSLGDFSLEGRGALQQAAFSQGCKPGSLYDDAAFGTPNGLSIPFFIVGTSPDNDTETPLVQMGTDPDTGRPFGPLLRVDPYGGMMQSRDLRVINSIRDPRYRAKTDVFELSVSLDVTPNVSFMSQTAYVQDQIYSFQDYNRFNTVPVFNDSSRMIEDSDSQYPSFKGLLAGGVYCDPQLGCSNSIAGFDISQAKSEQFSQEFRIQSSLDGPFNFSAGANYTRYSTLEDYYVMFNLITLLAQTPAFLGIFNGSPDYRTCAAKPSVPGLGFEGQDQVQPFTQVSLEDPVLSVGCIYIDPNPVEHIDGDGHNYFRSKNPYRLQSTAAFGEVYWEATETIKVTAGLRYTSDRKIFTPVPSQVLLSTWITNAGDVDRGYPALPDIKQQWNEVTGRVGVDWKPDLSFTDETLLYAFYSRGYKGGGANPPGIGFSKENCLFGACLTPLPYPAIFKPEFINAVEFGAKNTLLGGGLVLNATTFYYDYKDYQVSQIKERTAVNENFSADIWGFELESVFVPTPDLRFNLAFGYQDTKIADGASSIDLMDRVAGHEGYVVVKPWIQLASNCVVPTDLAKLIGFGPDGNGGAGVGAICPGLGGPPLINGEVIDYSSLPNGGAGFYKDLSGNELPNAPHWTVSLGGEYGWDLLDGNWRATLRADAYWQSQSWARVYNDNPYDKLHGWYNANLSFWIEKPEDDLKFEFYVKNVLDDTPITDAFLNSDDTALTTNVFTLDPRLIGLQITKGF